MHPVRPRRANGTGAKEPARVIVRFSNTKRPRTTVRYGRKVGIRGRLINADGNPIAGAELRLLTRDLRQGATRSTAAACAPAPTARSA